MNRCRTTGLWLLAGGLGLTSACRSVDPEASPVPSQPEQPALNQSITEPNTESAETESAEQIQDREAVLSGYRDKLGVWFDQGLKTPSASPTMQAEAQALTLETLRQLDGQGKGELLKFLYQEQLIGQCPLTAARKYCTIPGRVPILSLVGADLRKARLQETSLNGADLRGTDLRGADLRNSDLTRVRLNKANLSGANLSGAKLLGADLSEAYLRVAILQRTIFGCENWHYCREPAVLRQVDLQAADLTGTDLGRTSLVGANLQEAVLVGARLAGADLAQASFVKADLSGASFSHYWKGSCSDGSWEEELANIDQTDFTGANLNQANFIGLAVDSSGLAGANLSNVDLDAAITGPAPLADGC